MHPTGRKRKNPSGEITMRASIRVLWLAVAVLATVAVPGGAVYGEDGDVNIDLAVRQVAVAPVRAHAGDRIHVEVVIENKAEGMGTTNAELLVNGKAVARQLFTWGRSQGERLHRMSFNWDTRGIPPGEYRIGAEAFVWGDSSPFDNRLDVTQPVVVAPPGGGFPGGEAAGGSATETDPRFGKSRIGG
jgi:hypothetical protein